MNNNRTQHLFIEADRGVTVEKDGQRRCMGCMELYSTEYDLCPHCGYPINTEVENALHMYPGTVLNEKYVVGKVLGYGGFGVTYLAWDTILQIKVAIKEYLPSEFSTRSAGQTRVTVFSGEKSKQFSDGLDKFVDEAKRLAMFRNEPGIVKIFDSFEENGTAYIAMEYLEGETLAEYLEREKTVSVDEAVQMLMPVIESLNKVHDEGIIHRDIAPDNIFLTTKGEVKLIDFGASRYATTSRSRSLTVIIKPGYSAEEQYRSRGDQGSHTDVYSIGAVLYRMVTGQTPPDAMERRAQYEKNRKDILVPISKTTKGISKSQENSILNAMNVRIEDRTPDMITLAGELLSDEPVKRRKSGLRKIDPLTWPLWAKIGVPLAIVAVIVLSILLAFGIIGPKSTLRTDFNIPDGQTLVPDVVADELEDAQKRLEKYDLQWRIKDTKLSETIKSGLVLMHEPDAGNIAPIGTYIDITISAGLGTAFVEDFTGYTFEDAKKALEDLGFVVEIKDKRNSEYGAGIVFDQSVKAASAEKGTEITLYVSKGQKVDTSVDVAIPNIVGKTYDEAREILGDSNLTIVKSTKVVYDATKAVGEIVSQTPTGGTTGHKGDRVTVTVNAGAKKVRVPNVTNITKEQAIKELEAAGLVANVEYGKNQYYAEGTVFEQSVSADKEVVPGTTVTITVSEGYMVRVPNVNGMELSEAQSTLRHSGFASSIKEYKSSTNVENGHVISQSVTAGSEVDADTVIYLTVSSGTNTTVKAATTTTKSTTENATKYKFTIVAGDSGVSRVYGNGNYSVGEKFDVSAEFKDGYTVDTVKMTGLGEMDAEFNEWAFHLAFTMGNSTSFTMPASNITVTVTSILDSELSETTTVPESTSQTTATTQGSCGNNLTWTLNTSTGKLVISGTGTMTDWSSDLSTPWCSKISNIKTVIIGNGVTNIGYHAFEGCKNLTSVTISDSVSSIGDFAFSRCDSLTNIAIPNSVTSIGYHAFFSCYSLSSVTIGNNVTNIGSHAFSNCYSLTNLTIGNSVTSIGDAAFGVCNNLTSVTIPNSVTSIGSQAFSHCNNLTSVTIPNSVTSIGSQAFSHCDNLTDVYYSGTKSQWGKISIGSYNSPLTNATIHYNS